MWKKIMFFGVMACLVTNAESANVMNATNNEPEIIKFEIVSDKHQIMMGGGTPSTFVIYNNQTILSWPSDPIRLVCNNKIKIINKGSSAVCKLAADKTGTLEIEPNFYKHGSTGFAVAIIN